MENKRRKGCRVSMKLFFWSIQLLCVWSDERTLQIDKYQIFFLAYFNELCDITRKDHCYHKYIAAADNMATGDFIITESFTATLYL